MYEREVKDYCRRAGSLLACGRAQRQRFDRLTRQSVQEYLQEVPGASWPEVEQTLGQIAAILAQNNRRERSAPVRHAMDKALEKKKQ